MDSFHYPVEVMSTRVNAFSDSVAVHLDGLKEVRPTRFHLPLLSLSMSGPPESPLHGLLPPARSPCTLSYLTRRNPPLDGIAIIFKMPSQKSIWQSPTLCSPSVGHQRHPVSQDLCYGGYFVLSLLATLNSFLSFCHRYNNNDKAKIYANVCGQFSPLVHFAAVWGSQRGQLPFHDWWSIVLCRQTEARRTWFHVSGRQGRALIAGFWF